jgi:hypothetical protein
LLIATGIFKRLTGCGGVYMSKRFKRVTTYLTGGLDFTVKLLK